MPDRTPQKKNQGSEASNSPDHSGEIHNFAPSNSGDGVPRISEAAAAKKNAAITAYKLEPGALIGNKYQVINDITNGNRNAIFEVEDIFSKRRLALKIFRGGANESVQRRFQHELCASELLDDPSIFKILGHGEIDDTTKFYVYENVEGITLADYLSRCARLTFDDMMAVFIPLAQALDEVHAKNIVHCTIKPANILLIGEQGNWRCMLLGFGGSKVEGLARLGHALGKEILENPQYLSPEQCQGKTIDGRSDIYSLGCTLFEAITAVPPFSGPSREAVMKMHVHADPPSLKEASLGRAFPEALEVIVKTMLEKAPDQRFQTARQVAESLMRLKMGTNNPTPRRVHSTNKKANPEKTIVILGILAAIIFGCIIYVCTPTKALFPKPVKLNF